MSELAANRKQTTAFIAARPVDLVLIPIVPRKTASGGSVWDDGTARPSQRFRLIEQTTTSGNSPGRLPAADGKQLRVVWQLLGEWDSSMGVGDHWTDPATGAGYRIEELLPFNGYERRGRVVEYG